jgi:hypothetical protein
LGRIVETFEADGANKQLRLSPSFLHLPVMGVFELGTTPRDSCRRFFRKISENDKQKKNEPSILLAVVLVDFSPLNGYSIFPCKGFLAHSYTVRGQFWLRQRPMGSSRQENTI